MTDTGWKCGCCGENRPAMRNGLARYCGDCDDARRLFRTTESNLTSGFNRKNKGSPDLGVTFDEFCKWRKSKALTCCYCGIQQCCLPRHSESIVRELEHGRWLASPRWGLAGTGGAAGR